MELLQLLFIGKIIKKRYSVIKNKVSLYTTLKEANKFIKDE